MLQGVLQEPQVVVVEKPGKQKGDKMRNFIGSLAVGCVLFACQTQADIILNGSFESNNVGDNDGSVLNWSMSGGIQEVVDTALWGPTFGTPPSPKYLFMDGGEVKISQNLGTVTPDAYLLTAWFGAAAGSSLTPSISLQGVGSPFAYSFPIIAGAGWTQETVIVPKTYFASEAGNPITLTLQSDIVSGSTSNYTGFDEIGMTVVPEPASLSLLAFGGLALLRRRR